MAEATFASGRPGAVPIGPRPPWYQEAVFYELHVRAFADGDGDGQGDFAGLTARLDYLRELGLSALWLLPFYPSPLKDDGYDISDYTSVNPAYGTLADFQGFLGAAHDRGLRVITELVLNHTSDQHPWFQRARRADAGSAERDFYIWSEHADRFSGARVIFRDFEGSNWAWDPVARAYYFHRFYSHQPDLNYDNPEVTAAILRILDFWLGMGVDGLRLDAVPYLFKREGTTCENLPETHAFLRRLRAHIDANFADRMLLAEANQWPEDAAEYFGAGRGDECHTAFHFPLMPRMFMAIRMESRFPIVDILEQTPPIPTEAQWMLFLRNHDELTLEMVSDEERDFMYRMYATEPRARVNLGIRRRLAPLLNNDRRLIELMTRLLLSLPGTPVLYYGDEIGMGDNIYLGDRNGVRSPMQWSAEKNAGFSTCNPQMLYLPVIVDPEYHYQAVNVETQQANLHSLLWFMRRIIALRNQNPVFGHGALTLLRPENARVLAFLRGEEADRMLIVANLCHLPQSADLDLAGAGLKGARPVELSGATEFPVIGADPYRVTLGPYDVFWFRLEPAKAGEVVERAALRTPVHIPEVAGWMTLARRLVRPQVDEAMRRYIPTCRWFRGKGDSPRSATLTDDLALGSAPRAPHIGIVQVEFAVGEPHRYVVPLALIEGDRIAEVRKEHPETVLAVLDPGTHSSDETLLIDAAHDKSFVRALFDRIAESGGAHAEPGPVKAVATDALDRSTLAADRRAPIAYLTGDQSNSSTRIGEKYVLKLYRALGGDVNPELELGLFLGAAGRFPHIAPVAGYVEARLGRGIPETLAILHAYVPNEGTGWAVAQRELALYFERVDAFLSTGGALPAPRPPRAADEHPAPGPETTELIGPFLEMARLLGVRTAEMHRALASDRDDPAFAPEPMDPYYLRAIFQTMQAGRRRSFDLLRRNLPHLPPELRELADRLLAREPEIDRRTRAMLGRRFSSFRTRIHGDFHLDQVLWTGKDFVVIDFEGEPARPMSERRIKRSPLRDVAGMLRSFDYAAQTALANQPTIQEKLPEHRHQAALAAQLWTGGVAQEYLRAYRATAGTASFVPQEPAEFDLLLEPLLLEKAVYELGYELGHRPAWLHVPLRGLEHLLGGPG